MTPSLRTIVVAAGAALLVVAPAAFPARAQLDELSAEAQAFHQSAGHGVWVDAQGLTVGARALLARLGAAGEEGLAPLDYEIATLDADAAALQRAMGTDVPADAWRFEQRLTRNALKFFRHLHLGRVDARDMGFQLDHAMEPHDFVPALRRVVAGASLDQVLRDLYPPFVQYRELRLRLGGLRREDPARAVQVELAMERLRWLPEFEGERLIVVNIPMFGLWGFDADRSSGAPTIAMAAIIGRAAVTRTPIFTAQVSSVVFNPDWNVPESIVRNEILPKLERDPGYLARNHMKIVGGGAIPRVRQAPGPWNALGRVKFVFPNPHGVFMHDTPAPELFARARRDFSHGCIRVAEPIALAEWVLREQAPWTGEQISRTINGGATRMVGLARGPRVVVFYMTAAFEPNEGHLRFSDDIYGHDARLAARLRAYTGGVQ